jgi:hypothetical protein
VTEAAAADLVRDVRTLGEELNLRVEICSHDGHWPVSVSDKTGKVYGFGGTVTEALKSYRERLAKTPKVDVPPVASTA